MIFAAMKLALSNINAIVFDIGGVLLNIDESKTIIALQGFRYSSSGIRIEDIKQYPVFTKFEKGLMDEEQFRSELRSLLQLNVSNADFDKAWLATLGDFPDERIQMLRRLKRKFRLFLLSNTNKIHLAYFLNYLDDRYGKNIMDALFEKCYYSCRLGMRKPDKEIFRYVMKDAGLSPDHTLFIDDSLSNVKGAEEEGWQTYHLRAGKEVCDLF